MKKNKKTGSKKSSNVIGRFLDLLERNHDRFLLAFATIVILNVLFLIVFRGPETICGLVSASEGFLESKIRNESVDHFAATERVIKSAEKRIHDIEKNLGWPQKNTAMKSDDRLELLEQLQRLDEISYDLEWVENEYFTDHSIQYYPYSTGCLASYVYETRHLKKSIDRFVRVSETALLFNFAGRRQTEIVEGELNEVKAYLENLDQFKKELHLLGGESCDKEGVHEEETL